jgi:PqqD family protein of HPr-rel-A system
VEAATNILWKSAKLVWKCWGDEVVVYNVDSGNTHLLTPVAAQVLKILETEPLDAMNIAQRLALSADLNVEQELTRHVEDLIVRLDDLGLAAPAV